MAMTSSSTRALLSTPPPSTAEKSASKTYIVSFPATNASQISLKLGVHFCGVLRSRRCSADRSAPKLVDSEVLEEATILVSEKLEEAGLEVLRSFGNMDCSYDLSPEGLCSKICECDTLIVRSGTKVTREVFEAAKGRLKVVGCACVDIDNVDMQAATEFGCLVVNAPTANTVAAPEHGIALLTAMARNLAQADASIKASTN